MNNSKAILKKYFGYDDFRPGQNDIINHILNNEDTLAIMPTGAGKSICYQVPAMIFPGVTIVISPLISLMKDQVDTLSQVGIPATFVNSSLTPNEYAQTIKNIEYNIYKIIYVAPERLISESFISLLNTINISMIAIDEAHCVSQWGHDFRPSYRDVSNVILNLKQRPVVTAFTATATAIVRDDIIKLLHLNNPFTLTTGFDRPNLFFSVETPQNKENYVLNFLNENKDSSGIIYCLTRKTVDSLYEKLKSKGFSVSKYHGGMDEKKRTSSQEDFVFDRTLIMIATNAFGMGIDKSNIRYVIHYNMPKDLESYYQEAGRAGRDGDISKCILLFSRADIVTAKFLIEETSSSSHKIEYDKLNDIVDYCNTDKCLRKYILEYFNEKPTFNNCENCGNCLSEIESTNITTDSQKILSCIKRMNEHFGSSLVTDVLKGSKSSKIKSFHFDTLSTYGLMKDYPKDTIKDLIYYLITEGYIKSIGDKYPILSLSSTANDILFGKKEIFIKRKIQKVESKVSSINIDNSIIDYDEKLFILLRELRSNLALTFNVPPFVIFADTSLKQMSAFYPTTLEEMLNISGVGAHKLEVYGEVFISTISNYVVNNNIQKQNIVINSQIKKPEAILDDIQNSKKENTVLTSYNLYKEGKSIKEISEMRAIREQTIEEHLVKCFELGMDINLDNVVQLEYKDKIFDILNNIGYERLRPIKDSLPNTVNYFTIKYCIALYKKKV